MCISVISVTRYRVDTAAHEMLASSPGLLWDEANEMHKDFALCIHFMLYAVSEVESDDNHSDLMDVAPLSTVRVLPQRSSSPIQQVEPETPLLGDLEDDIHTLIADSEETRLETRLDTWCFDLKRNVLVCWVRTAVCATCACSTCLVIYRSGNILQSIV